MTTWMKRLRSALAALAAFATLFALPSPAAAGEQRCAGFTVTITGTAGNDVIHGTSGRDVINAGRGADIVYGGGGSDIICGGRGPDTIYGGPGDDFIKGGNSRDELHGNAGADAIQGNIGQDVIIGGVGTDACVGWVSVSSCESFSATEASAIWPDVQAMVDRVNAVRTSRGASPLMYHPGLAGVAQAWTSDMAGVNHIRHNPSFAEQTPGDWFAVGENVGYASSAREVQGLLEESARHLANIVDSRYSHIGIGVVSDGNRIWITQNFAGYDQ